MRLPLNLRLDPNGSVGKLVTTLQDLLSRAFGQINRNTDKLSDWVSVKDYGAKGDGATDDSAAIQAALNYAATLTSSQVCEIRFPAGRYYCANNSAVRLQIKSSVRLVGAGMNQSVIVFNDSASASRRDLLITDATGAYDIEIEGLCFQGDWGTSNYTERSHLMQLYTTGTVHLRKCRFSDSRFMATVIGYAKLASVTDCEYLRVAVDGVHAVRCDSAVVTNNFFQNVNDDAIGIHSNNSDAAPVKHSAVVVGNRLVDSQGICVAGAKHVVISDNTITRAHTRAIQVGASSGAEGITSTLSVSITDNVIDTVFDGFRFSASSGSSTKYIYVDVAQPSVVAGSGYVGQPDGSGGIVSPFPYFYTNDTATTAPSPGAWFIKIANNTCVRTLAPTTNYSDYGYGTRLGRSGPADPAVTAADLGSARAMVEVHNHAQALCIQGNLLWGGGYGVWLNSTSASAWLAWRDVVIQGNKISNFNTAGVYAIGTGVVSIKGNTFDGDPLHVHAQRNANGKWTNTVNDCAAVWADTAKFIVTGNEFRNVQTLYRGTASTDAQWKQNVLYCNPAVESGWNANNIGIGSMPRTVLGDYSLVIEDGDPASATYGTVLNVCQNASDALPTTGTYVQKWVTRNSNPSVAGVAGSKYIIYGWMRLTTGSAHTLNTDWSELRTLTGT